MEAHKLVFPQHGGPKASQLRGFLSSSLRPLILAFGVIASTVLTGVQASASPDPSKPLDGITFASHPGELYASVRGISQVLGKDLGEDATTGAITLGGHPLKSMRNLFNGEGIVTLDELRDFGATVDWDQASELATIQWNGATAHVHQGAKSVIVDKSSQSLMAYQGGTLVLATHVSTGREGHGTPNGKFTAGPAKERMHRSRLYHFAPMPWSVQVNGNVFIHGYTSVPNRPASHGCIRVPLTRGNPAHYFYNWVDIGTPVTIQGVWGTRVSHRATHSRFAMGGHRHHRHHRNRFVFHRHHRWSHRWAMRRFGHHMAHRAGVHRSSGGSVSPSGPMKITQITPMQ